MLDIAYYFSFIIWCSTFCGYYIPGFAMALRHIYIYISVCVCVCLSAFLVAYDENVHHKYLNDLGLSIM
jgi:hypothetical protein